MHCVALVHLPKTGACSRFTLRHAVFFVTDKLSTTVSHAQNNTSKVKQLHAPAKSMCITALASSV